MLKKTLFSTILAIQFVALASAVRDMPNPPCPPSGCPIDGKAVAADMPNPPCPPSGCPIIPQP